MVPSLRWIDGVLCVGIILCVRQRNASVLRRILISGKLFVGRLSLCVMGTTRQVGFLGLLEDVFAT